MEVVMVISLPSTLMERTITILISQPTKVGAKYDPNTMVLQWNSFDAWDTKNYLVPKPWI